MRALSILALSGLLVSACAPSPMPKGYTYHHQTYKTAPAPEADEIGYDFTADKNAFVVGVYKDIAADLLAKMEQKYLIADKKVYLQNPALETAVTQSLDHAFRSTLQENQYMLSGHEQGVVRIELKTKEPSEEEAKTLTTKTGGIIKAYAKAHGSDENRFKPLHVHLYASHDAGTEFRMSETYVVPLFGYIPDYIPAFKWQKNQGKALHLSDNPEDQKRRYKPEPALVITPRPALTIVTDEDGEGASVLPQKSTVQSEDLNN